MSVLVSVALAGIVGTASLKLFSVNVKSMRDIQATAEFESKVQVALESLQHAGDCTGSFSGMDITRFLQASPVAVEPKGRLTYASVVRGGGIKEIQMALSEPNAASREINGASTTYALNLTLGATKVVYYGSPTLKKEFLLHLKADNTNHVTECNIASVSFPSPSPAPYEMPQAAPTTTFNASGAPTVLIQVPGVSTVLNYRAQGYPDPVCTLTRNSDGYVLNPVDDPNALGGTVTEPYNPGDITYTYHCQNSVGESSKTVRVIGDWPKASVKLTFGTCTVTGNLGGSPASAANPQLQRYAAYPHATYGPTGCAGSNSNSSLFIYVGTTSFAFNFYDDRLNFSCYGYVFPTASPTRFAGGTTSSGRMYCSDGSSYSPVYIDAN